MTLNKSFQHLVNVSHEITQRVERDEYDHDTLGQILFYLKSAFFIAEELDELPPQVGYRICERLARVGEENFL